MRDPMMELAAHRIAELRAEATLHRYAAARAAERRAAARVSLGHLLVRLGERLQAPRPARSAVSS